tara:strand:+ start:286 stop:465 length:180 start_codon:yes stop_codon:yes gene_type:complete
MNLGKAFFESCRISFRVKKAIRGATRKATVVAKSIRPFMFEKEKLMIKSEPIPIKNRYN